MDEINLIWITESDNPEHVILKGRLKDQDKDRALMNIIIDDFYYTGESTFTNEIINEIGRDYAEEYARRAFIQQLKLTK